MLRTIKLMVMMLQGKTGTAQVADPDNGGYVEGENHILLAL